MSVLAAIRARATTHPLGETGAHRRVNDILYLLERLEAAEAVCEAGLSLHPAADREKWDDFDTAIARWREHERAKQCEEHAAQLLTELEWALNRIQQLEDKYEPPESRPC